MMEPNISVPPAPSPPPVQPTPVQAPPVQPIPPQPIQSASSKKRAIVAITLQLVGLVLPAIAVLFQDTTLLSSGPLKDSIPILSMLLFYAGVMVQSSIFSVLVLALLFIVAVMGLFGVGFLFLSAIYLGNAYFLTPWLHFGFGFLFDAQVSSGALPTAQLLNYLFYFAVGLLSIGGIILRWRRKIGLPIMIVGLLSLAPPVVMNFNSLTAVGSDMDSSKIETLYAQTIPGALEMYNVAHGNFPVKLADITVDSIEPYFAGESPAILGELGITKNYAEVLTDPLFDIKKDPFEYSALSGGKDYQLCVNPGRNGVKKVCRQAMSGEEFPVSTLYGGQGYAQIKEAKQFRDDYRSLAIQSIRISISKYFVDKKVFPPSLQTLPTTYPIVRAGLILDPQTNQPYRYELTDGGRNYRICHNLERYEFANCWDKDGVTDVIYYKDLK